MVQTRSARVQHLRDLFTRAAEAAAAEATAAAEQRAREDRVIALDGLVCRIVNTAPSASSAEPARERSPRRRFARGALTVLDGETAAPGSYIRRFLAHALPAQ